jgi:hypothetical protein
MTNHFPIVHFRACIDLLLNGISHDDNPLNCDHEKPLPSKYPFPQRVQNTAYSPNVFRARVAVFISNKEANHDFMRTVANGI